MAKAKARRKPAKTTRVSGLNARSGKSATVKGGSLQAYYEKVTGEKQGKFKGG